jgi:hypothetical protein
MNTKIYKIYYLYMSNNDFFQKSVYTIEKIFWRIELIFYLDQLLLIIKKYPSIGQCNSPFI